MVARIATIDAVVSVGVNLHFKLLVDLYEGFAHFRDISEMHVVVSSAMNEKQTARKIGRTLHRIDGISRSVFIGRAHIALRIDGVVILPVAWCCNGHSGLKDRAALRHGHQRIESAEAPSPDANVCFINIGQTA